MHSIVPKDRQTAAVLAAINGEALFASPTAALDCRPRATAVPILAGTKEWRVLLPNKGMTGSCDLPARSILPADPKRLRFPMIALVGSTRNVARQGSPPTQFMRHAEQSTRCVVFRPPSAFRRASSGLVSAVNPLGQKMQVNTTASHSDPPAARIPSYLHLNAALCFSCLSITSIASMIRICGLKPGLRGRYCAQLPNSRDDISNIGNLMRIPCSVTMLRAASLAPGRNADTRDEPLSAARRSAVLNAGATAWGSMTASGPMCPPVST
jgi:hypothetical protein